MEHNKEKCHDCGATFTEVDWMISGERCCPRCGGIPNLPETSELSEKEVKEDVIDNDILDSEEMERILEGASPIFEHFAKEQDEKNAEFDKQQNACLTCGQILDACPCNSPEFMPRFINDFCRTDCPRLVHYGTPEKTVCGKYGKEIHYSHEQCGAPLRCQECMMEHKLEEQPENTDFRSEEERKFCDDLARDAAKMDSEEDAMNVLSGVSEEDSLCIKCGNHYENCTCIRGACDLIRHLASIHGIESIRVFGTFNVLHSIMGISFTSSDGSMVPSLATIDETVEHDIYSVMRSKHKLVIRPEIEGLASEKLYQMDFDSLVKKGYYKILVLHEVPK